MSFDIFDSLAELAIESFASLLNTDGDITCISLLMEPSFEENSLIQFTKSNYEVKWKRTIWDKKKDIETTLSPILSLKYLSNKIIPSMLTSESTTTSKNVLVLFENLERFKDYNENEKSNLLILDGCSYTLKICSDKFTKTFKWTALPATWQPIEDFANTVIVANNTLFC